MLRVIVGSQQRLEIRLHHGLDAAYPRELDQLSPVRPLALPIQVDRFPDGIHADLVPIFDIPAFMDK